MHYGRWPTSHGGATRPTSWPGPGLTQCKPEDFQLPARSLGYQLVLDYKIDQLGHQDTHQGMILVDGSFYCPAMPEPLINATKDLRDGKIDGAIHRARIAERKHFAIRARANPMPMVISG